MEKYYKRIDVVKNIINQFPNVKDRLLLQWNDERPDLGHLKSAQLLVRIAMDFLKQYDGVYRMPSIIHYADYLEKNGCPIPKRPDKLRKYQDAMNRQRTAESMRRYEDDDDDRLSFSYPYDDSMDEPYYPPPRQSRIKVYPPQMASRGYDYPYYG
jgi:hypothetical protein